VANFAYDAQGHRTSRSTPAKGLTYYTYDPVGNLTGID
jgi:uncharacterized protein RhaS with RHS repeats